MSNYIVSARKYRPDTFESVVGQENITRTLKNAIRQEHLAQAYLFCGPRGVGKTTNARIFAKTINCSNLDADTNPCNQCESCQSFNQQRSMNIHELDAASNNSVEDIRNLIDQVRIPPQIGQYSVYIIDEVHMLSSSAFNAFLKTLEEPPKHAVFILATTEKHKILPTILSRCQVYDFNRITVKDIVDRLQYVASQENIKAENEALQIIAQKADGAMRDALSIFDQIVSFSGANITYQDAIENLNVLDYDYYFRLTDALLAGDHLNSLLIFNDILNKGFEGNYFITGLASHLRDILISKDQGTADLLEVGESIKQIYLQKAALAPESFLIQSLEIATECDYKYKTSHNKRLHVELALIRMATLIKQANKTSGNATPSMPQSQAPKETTTKQATSHTIVAETSAEYKKAENTAVAKPTQTVNKTVENEVKTEPQPTQKKQETQQVPKRPPVSFSLKTDLGKTQEKSTETQTQSFSEKIESTNDFSQDELNNAWKTMAEKHKEQPRIYQNLIKYLPKKSENFQIKVQVPSESLKNVLQELRVEIINELQKQLQNGKIDLIINVSENTSQVQKRAYTAEEKYQEMVKNNPQIEIFRNAIDGNIK